MNPLPDGLVLFCKRECETCAMVEPVMAQLAAHLPLTVYTQDDPAFPAGLPLVVDDTTLEHSFQQNIEIVPTLIRVEAGQEKGRIMGWNRAEWERFSGLSGLGEGLPAFRPGCGSLSAEPGMAEQLAARFAAPALRARRVSVPPASDPLELCFDMGWSDGLPLVPPTAERVQRMLAGSRRAPGEVVGIVPPDNVACTVEKVAINAVMAGCKPEYLPVVLAAVEAACLDDFCMHGVLATTYFAGPVVVVNGPVAGAVGMNAGINALGQGNRANATIGRALQLVIRNVGGGRPGGVDRATMGNPGKVTFCFAENEASSPWEPLSVTRGFPPGTSTVTLFAGSGLQPIVDQLSRTPESLARTFAACLRSVTHPKLPLVTDALLLVSPEHGRLFRQAGWSKARLLAELDELLQLPGAELARGAGGMAEGVPPAMLRDIMPKFRPGGLSLIHVGGQAGLFSAIIPGWPGGGAKGSQPVTVPVTP